MFSFAYPFNLLLLSAVPAMVLLYVWARYVRRRNLRRFGTNKALTSLMPAASPYKPPLKITLRMIALSMIILAVCRPWGGLKDESTERRGIEIMIAVDASNSMNAPVGTDVEGPSRMRTAKLMLSKLISRLNDDRVGLIVYAGNAHTLIPVTSDYISASSFLNSIDPSQFSEQGTNISAAIEAATASFSDAESIGRAIVLITDAEELENVEGVNAAVRNARSNDIQVNVIGVGGTEAVPIPEGHTYMTDDQGQTVRTALNEDLAASIARVGGGIYVNASTTGALNELEKQLDTLQKTSLQTNVYALHDELFGIFAWIALGFLILDIFILDRKISWLDRITFFKKEKR